MYQLQGFILPYILDIASGKITSKAITMHLVGNNKYLPLLEKIFQNFFYILFNIINKNISKKFSSVLSSGRTLTKNEIKDIVIVTRSIQNRRFLLKRTAGKFIDKEGELLNFLDQLMRACLPLMKHLLTS